MGSILGPEVVEEAWVKRPALGGLEEDQGDMPAGEGLRWAKRYALLK